MTSNENNDNTSSPDSKNRSAGTNIRVIARFRPLISIESDAVDPTKAIHYVGDN